MIRGIVTKTWNAVMDSRYNPLSNIPDLNARHLVMQILAWMWCIIFSMRDPRSRQAYMRSYEEMVTQTEERERDMKQRLDAGGSVGDDWVSAALNCGRGINALREAGEL